MMDYIEGTELAVNCVIEEYLDNYQLWDIYTEYTYAKDNKSLYEMPFLFSNIIHFFEMDKDIVIEARRNK